MSIVRVRWRTLRRAAAGVSSPSATPKRASLRYKKVMALSARNQLQGTIEGLRIGDIMAHVVVRVGDNLIESVITRASAEALGLKVGDKVKAVIKSTEVIIQKD